MKKFILYLFFLNSIGLLAANNDVPSWMDAQQRESMYPVSKYYTGFSSATIQKGEDKIAVYDRVKQNARVEAISSIQVSVEQTIKRIIQNGTN